MSDKDISGMGSVNPADRKMYEQEYKQSADLFKRALNEYVKSENPYQQAQFKSVMEKAMQALNETARELKRNELLKQNAIILKDYAEFQKFPEDPDTQQKLNNDLDRAKKTLG